MRSSHTVLPACHTDARNVPTVGPGNAVGNLSWWRSWARQRTIQGQPHWRIGESLQHPGEDGLVHLEIGQATRARYRRVIRRCLGQHQPRKVARANESAARHAMARSASSVRNSQSVAIGVASRRQAGSTLVRIEPLAQTLDESVEVVLVRNLIQSRVERVGRFEMGLPLPPQSRLRSTAVPTGRRFLSDRRSQTNRERSARRRGRRHRRG